MTELDKLFSIDTVEVAKLSDHDLRLFAQVMYILDSAVSGELERRGLRDHVGYHRLLVEADESLNRDLPPQQSQALRTQEAAEDVAELIKRAKGLK
jgi:hypothetical protein